MNPAEARTSSKLYAKIFLTLILCIVVTIVALSSALYASFERSALSNLYASEKSSLAQTSYSAKSMIETSTNYALQIYADPQLDKLLHYPSSGSAMETTAALNRLNTYLNLNYFFHSIYIYSKNSKTFYSSSVSSINAVEAYGDFYDADARKLVERFGDYKRLAPIPRTIPVPTPFQDPKTANVYTFVFYDLLGKSEEIDNMVMLNVPERWMKEAISSLDSNRIGSTFIIDGHGQLVTSTDAMPFLADLNDKPYVRKVLDGSADQASDYFVGDVEGVKSLVVYSRHEQTGWIFMRVLPYDAIMGKIDSMKRTVLLVCFAILMLGLSISFFLSRSLYKPIGKVLARLNTLMKEKSDNEYRLKQSFLHQLLRHGEHRLPSNPESELQAFDIRMDPAGDYVVVLLVIDRFDAFAGRYPFKDRVLLKYGMMNMAGEWFAGLGSGVRECVDMDEKTIAVLVNGTALKEQPICDIVKSIQDSTERYLGLSVSASVSRIGDSLAGVSELYAEAQQQLEFKFIEGYRCILHSREPWAQATAPFLYPTTLESYMLEALKLGKAEEAKSRFAEIVRFVEPPAYMVYNMLFNQLAFSISTAAAQMDKSAGTASHYDFSAFIQQMHKLETLQDVIDHFGGMVDRLCCGFKEKKSTKHDTLIATVDGIVRRQYADRELSLYKIAETLDMSPAYLGRLFKKLAAKSVPDYVNEYRIERAKELLAGTQDSIEEISQKTGYNNPTYFYKVFKKYTGLTPAEYRQS